jgi:hypothetical protein
LPVFDAKVDQELHTTRRDVRISTPGDSRACAAVQTCYRQLKATDAVIYRSVAFIRLQGNDHYNRWMVPTSLRSQLSVIDQGGKFFPTTYRLKAPPKSKRLGKATGIPKKGWKRKEARPRSTPVKVSPLMRPAAPRGPKPKGPGNSRK